MRGFILSLAHPTRSFSFLLLTALEESFCHTFLYAHTSHLDAKVIMKTIAALALSTLALLPYVSAHGFVNKLVVDGKSYAGNVPNAQTSMSSSSFFFFAYLVEGSDAEGCGCG